MLPHLVEANELMEQISGLVQDCGISTADALRILYFHNKPSKYITGVDLHDLVNEMKCEQSQEYDNNCCWTFGLALIAFLLRN